MKIKLFIILFVPLFSLITILGLIDWISYYPKLNKEYQTIVNYGYLGSFLSGTLGIAFTASTLVFLAKTLNFERRKSDQDNFDSRFFLMLGTLENIKYKIDEHVKNEILKEINQISEFTIEETLVKSKRIIHKNNSQIGHYFRMLYQILKMIDPARLGRYNRNVMKGGGSVVTFILVLVVLFIIGSLIGMQINRRK